jgi:glycosyltransferase involved in cell wall biosynthesis
MEYFNPSVTELTLEIRSWQPYILFTGSMDYFPNVDAVTFFYRKVFPAIRQRSPHAHFVIAGRNPTKPIRDLARDPSVHVTGAVPDIRPYLNGASVAVAPMRIARGVQNKILEAMAMGIPVAASQKAAAALPEALMRTLHVEDDPEALTIFLIDILRDKTPQKNGLRDTLFQYLANLDSEKQLESILLRAVRTHLQEHDDPSRRHWKSSQLSNNREDTKKQGKIGAQAENNPSAQPLESLERISKADES